MEIQNVSNQELLELIINHRSFLQVANSYEDSDRAYELESVIEYFSAEADRRNLAY